MTRNLILEQAGYRVLATDDAAEALRIFTASPVHAVVLGDSLQAEKRLDLGARLKDLRPKVPIIILYRMSGFRVPPAIADEQVESLGDPQLLLDAIRRVLDGSDGRK